MLGSTRCNASILIVLCAGDVVRRQAKEGIAVCPRHSVDCEPLGRAGE